MPGQRRPPPPPDISKIHESIVENQTQDAIELEGGIKQYLEKMAVIKYKKRDEDSSPTVLNKKRKHKLEVD